MSEDRYLVLHSAGSDPGWTMAISDSCGSWTMAISNSCGRKLMSLDKARTEAENLVKKNPNACAMIVEAVYLVKTEYPPVRIRRFK